MTTTEQSYATSPQLAERLKKYQHIATFIGLIFLALTLVGYFTEGTQQFLRSYLVGFFFWFGMGMGCLVLLMIHHVSGGAWGVMIRRPLEAGTRSIYLFWLGFLPLLLLSPKLYVWANAAHATDKFVEAKHLYLNLPFAWIRWVFYGIVWLGLTYLLNKWSKLEDETRSMNWSRKIEKLAAPGIVAYFYTIGLCSIDYLMSLDITWSSTVYGFLIASGQAMGAMAFVVAILVLCAQYAPIDEALTKKHLHDLGKLMLALVMFWAYMSFSQLLIIYSGNLPEEVSWYVRRFNGGWGWVGLIILLFHFTLPFCLLLSQSLKKNPKTISAIAIFIVCIRMVDAFWLVEPNFTNLSHPAFAISWLDITAPLGFGGLWLAMFFRTLPTRPLLPLGTPDLQKALNHGRH